MDESPILYKQLYDKLEKIADTQTDQGFKMTRATVLLEELVGTATNPGRLPKLEMRLEDLHSTSQRMKGIGIAWAGFLTLLAAITAWVKGH